MGIIENMRKSIARYDAYKKTHPKKKRKNTLLQQKRKLFKGIFKGRPNPGQAYWKAHYKRFYPKGKRASGCLTLIVVGFIILSCITVLIVFVYTASIPTIFP